jgi:hypothetical protein
MLSSRRCRYGKSRDERPEVTRLVIESMLDAADFTQWQCRTARKKWIWRRRARR